MHTKAVHNEASSDYVCVLLYSQQPPSFFVGTMDFGSSELGWSPIDTDTAITPAILIDAIFSKDFMSNSKYAHKHTHTHTHSLI